MAPLMLALTVEPPQGGQMGPVVINPQPRVAPTHAPAFIAFPDWLHTPNGDDMTRLYPSEAFEKGIDGRAEIDCEVTSAGMLFDCHVVSEDPPGRGFGAATLALAPKFQMRPLTKDGGPVGGARVRLPIRWRLVRDAQPTDAGTPR